MTNEIQFDGSYQAVPLAAGYTLRAPGIEGQVRKVEPIAQARSAGLANQPGQPFLTALDRSGVELSAQFEINISGATDTKTRGGAQILETAQAEPALELTTPSLPNNMQSVVLYTDENGVSRWIWPAKTEAQHTSFYLPVENQDLPVAEKTGSRGVITVGIRKLVKVLSWKTDEIVGDLAEVFVKKWEDRHRPYGLYLVEPGKFSDNIPWDRMANGRALLLLHGTFSTGDGAFAGLIYSDVMTKLAAHYEGRIFAFNHPTLHHSPEENVQELLRMLPAEIKNLDLDIITHSRGGLVGRELCERYNALNTTDKTMTVHRAVFVAGPNNGTILTDKGNWMNLIDTYTNLLDGLPDNPYTITMEALITLIKVVGGGTLQALPGLQSMLPGGDAIKALNAAPKPGTDYYALAAHYQPTDADTAVGFGKSLLIKTIGKIFGEDSDLVVPTKGCYGMDPEAAGFPVPETRLKIYGAETNTHHLNFFQKEAVNQQIYEWLTAPLPSA